MEGPNVVPSISDAATGVLPALGDGALRGLVLFAAVGVGVLALRKASAATRHLAWVLALVGMAILPVLTLALPSWEILPRTGLGRAIDLAGLSFLAAGAPAAAPAAAPAPYPSSIQDVPALREAPSDRGAADPTAPRVPTFAGVPGVSERAGDSPVGPLSGLGVLTWVWLGGAGLLLARIALGQAALSVLVRRSARISSGPLETTLQEVRARLGIRRHVGLLLSNRRVMPMTWGLVRSSVLLPREAASWDEGRLRRVLTHELAHVRREDAWSQLFVQLACALYWFDPLVWIAAWRIRVEQERACDDVVLSTGSRASEYAGDLLGVAAGREVPCLARAAAIAMARPSCLEVRLRRVLDDGLRRTGITGRFVAAAFLAIACLVPPLAMLRAGTGSTGEPAPSSGVWRGGAARTGVFDATGVPALGAVRLLEPLQPEPLGSGDVRSYRATSGHVVANGFVFFCGEEEPSPEVIPGSGGPGQLEGARLYAVDLANGTVAWRKKLGGKGPNATPLVTGEMLVFADGDATVEAVEAKTGRALWQHELEVGAGIAGSPVEAGGAVFIAQAGPEAGGAVHALEAETGRPVWKTACGAGDWALATDGRRVYYGGPVGSHVGALDAKTGRELWRRDVGIESHPVVARGEVYVAGGPRLEEGIVAGQTLYALRAEDGELLWKHDLQPPRRMRIARPTPATAGPAVAGDRVIAPTLEGRLVALDADSGSVRWTTPIPGLFRSGPSVAGGIAYIAGGDESLHAVRASDGAILWKHSHARRLWSSPVVLDGALCVLDVACGILEVRTATHADEKIRRALDSTVVSFVFDGEPLADALDFLRQVADIPIGVDEGLDAEALKVRLDVSGAKLRDALDHICSHLKLTWAIRDGAVRVSAAAGEPTR